MLATNASAQFIVSVEGIENKDWFIVNYMDQDTKAGQIADYQCGTLTYDGHWGTDFVIRDFSQMDSGVYILAAGLMAEYISRRMASLIAPNSKIQAVTETS